MFKIALICGGPSQERGISLNSARSVLDHLSCEAIEIIPVYVDYNKNFYALSSAQLYSNTPADFDFKLNQTAKRLDRPELADLLRSVDLTFPVIHGTFGEDGELQAILEDMGVPFVGASSASCRQMFCKYSAGKVLKQAGFPTLPSLLLTSNMSQALDSIREFFEMHGLTRAIVKPSIGGSSIGVSSVTTPEEVIQKSQALFENGFAQKVLVEPFCEGREFTVMVFANREGAPVALVPTEIEMSYQNNQIFDYRKKYLPTNQATYHTPARFEDSITQSIRQRAEAIFKLFNMREFARLDGWLMSDGTLYFTDINPVSGLEQNSFLFRQSSLLGLTHQQILYYVVEQACRRHHRKPPLLKESSSTNRSAVHVLFGGSNAERQVSLMSGTNVWLKLLRSSRFMPTPFFYDVDGFIWKLPYACTLDHTVEEIHQHCNAVMQGRRDLPSYLEEVLQALGIQSEFSQQPEKMSLQKFLQFSCQEKAFVFIAMHGGEGEDGTLQSCLEAYGLKHNGSDAKASRLCMDKYLTGEVINLLSDPSLLSIPKQILQVDELMSNPTLDFEALWKSICQDLKSERFIIKPRQDGCSAGIVLIQSRLDLERYFRFAKSKITSIPAYSFENQKEVIEMPSCQSGEYLIEPYIETDRITIENQVLRHTPKQGWIELTVGVLELNGVYRALNPSIAVAEGAVLSLEEKFQGGTGVNLTPPPESIISAQASKKIKHLIEKAAQGLGIANYARIDVFFNIQTEKMIVIEANTLPGLTPSTVLYHQGLAEEPPLAPVKLLETLILSRIEKKEGWNLSNKVEEELLSCVD